MNWMGGSSRMQRRRQSSTQAQRGARDVPHRRATGGGFGGRSRSPIQAGKLDDKTNSQAQSFVDIGLSKWFQRQRDPATDTSAFGAASKSGLQKHSEETSDTPEEVRRDGHDEVTRPQMSQKRAVTEPKDVAPMRKKWHDLATTGFDIAAATSLRPLELLHCRAKRGAAVQDETMGSAEISSGAPVQIQQEESAAPRSPSPCNLPDSDLLSLRRL
mmetsp:Transcript_32743/g.72874  ORF Transcript_32743/g.72874 Transcript_32743/m.72874 type:complete len:215 (+) Transcript_32743:47-691(+)